MWDKNMVGEKLGFSLHEKEKKKTEPVPKSNISNELTSDF